MEVLSSAYKAVKRRVSTEFRGAAHGAAKLISKSFVPHQNSVQLFYQAFVKAVETIDKIASVEFADSEEARIVLANSKAKDHIKMMLQLLQTDMATYSSGARVDAHTPILELLLRHRIVRELCDRGIRDRPLGVLALILGFAANMLHIVTYPMLNHQSVHQPLSELISYATRYVKFMQASTLIGDTDARQNKLRTRSSANLISLLRVLWKKLQLDPGQLHLFYRDEPLDSSVIPSFDILTTLLPFVSRESDIGSMAREAFIVSVGIGDSKVDVFILNRTTFIEDCTRLICDSFKMFSESSRPASDIEIIRQMHSLRLHIKFVNAIIAASEKHAVSTVGAARVGTRLCDSLRRYFLEGSVKSALLKPSEADTHIAQVQVRVLISDLCGDNMNFIPNREKALRSSRRTDFSESLLEILCEPQDNSVGWRMINNTCSPSKTVSLSACALVSQVLKHAHPLQALHLLAIPHQTFATLQETLSPLPQELDEFLLTYPGIDFENTDANSYELMAVNDIHRLLFERTSFSFTYASTSTTLIRSTRKRQALYAWQQIMIEARLCDVPAGPLWSTVLIRLRTFANLSFDEQLALTGMCARMVATICVLVVAKTALAQSPPPPAKSVISLMCCNAEDATSNLGALGKLFVRLWTDLSAHVNRIPGGTKKFMSMKQMLLQQDPSVPNAGANGAHPPAHNTLVLGLIVIEQALLEMHGYVKATHTLCASPNSLECIAALLSEPQSSGERTPRILYVPMDGYDRFEEIEDTETALCETDDSDPFQDMERIISNLSEIISLNGNV